MPTRRLGVSPTVYLYILPREKNPAVVNSSELAPGKKVDPERNETSLNQPTENPQQDGFDCMDVLDNRISSQQ